MPGGGKRILVRFSDGTTEKSLPREQLAYPTEITTTSNLQGNLKLLYPTTPEIA